MKIEYSILWIDNEIKLYQENGTVERLRVYLFEHGFDSKIIPLSEESEIEKYITDTSFDLILSDYRLNDGTGEEVIKKIRALHIDTEILFYTSANSFGDEKESIQVLTNLNFASRISFHFGRDNLLEKIILLIDLTLHKLLELNSTRGLVMAMTSSLDNQICNLIHMLIEKKEIQDSILRSIFIEEILLKDKDSFENRQSFLKDIPYEANELRNFVEMTESLKRWNILRRLLKLYSNTESSIVSFLETTKNYQNEVIEVRNKFAHSREDIEGSTRVLKGRIGKKDYTYDKDTCISVRNQLRSYRDAIETFIRIIQE